MEDDTKERICAQTAPTLQICALRLNRTGDTRSAAIINAPNICWEMKYLLKQTGGPLCNNQALARAGRRPANECAITLLSSVAFPKSISVIEIANKGHA